MRIEGRKKCICLILQSGSSQDISLSQCHPIMNSRPLFCVCPAAFTPTDHGIYVELQKWVISLSLSLSLPVLLSPSLPCQVVDDCFSSPPSFSSSFSFSPRHHPKNLLLLPHNSLPTLAHASSPRWVRDREEGGNGRFWLTKMLRCNLVRAEMWSVCL